MLKSLEPNTTHGTQLSRLFCFDFDRPNCLGPDLAASHLMNYGEEFVLRYEKRREQADPLLRWAAFLHFIDTHEDTMVLSSMLDVEMSSFLRRLQDQNAFENSLVIVTSDHGLHYGPYFQSRSGRREATEPLLYIRVPPSVQEAHDMRAFKANAAMWTTPFDVHETMLSLTVPGIQKHERKGKSLFMPLGLEREACTGTEEIPHLYCELKASGVLADVPTSCTKMPKPPNVLSFYADLPWDRRTRFPMDCKAMLNKTASEASSSRRCQCATSHRKWYRCTEHPWGTSDIQSTSNPEEYFALVKCRGQKMSVDTRVAAGGNFIDRIQQRDITALSQTPTERPNIIFVEVDSASIAYADRHFPKTRSFLKRYAMKRDSNDQVQCNDDVCAAYFEYFSLNGPNSIANQVGQLRNAILTRCHI